MADSGDIYEAIGGGIFLCTQNKIYVHMVLKIWYIDLLITEKI